MLPKENRLTKNKEFEKVFKEGRAAYQGLLGIKCIKNGLAISRFGILIGIKVSKKAVERNKVKRRIREIIHLHLNEIAPGYDCSCYCLKPIISKEYEEIEIAVIACLKRLKLIK